MFEKIYLILFLSTIKLANCFYVIENFDEKEGILEDFRIENQWNDLNDFPQYFEIKAKHNGQDFKVNFNRTQSEHRKYPNIYVIDKNGYPKYYSLQKSEDFKHYVDFEGNAYATLIKSNNSNDSYRFIGRIFSKTEVNTTFDIYPVKKKENIKKFSLKDQYHHAIKKRTIVDETKTHSFLNTLNNKDYIIEKKRNLKSENLLRKLTKSGTGQAFVFNLETIIVADYSLINEHKRISKSEDDNVVFNNLRIYLSHVMHAVDQKYQNSFKNDIEMKINILLTNFVFVTDPAEAPWVNPSLVGDPNHPTYENQDVIVATPTIQSFKNYMESKTFPFEYDHAMALFKKDLWADGSDIPENRKGVAGFAYVAGTCENIRYSVTEEQGGFSSIFTIAHEIGHNLGSIHDGETGAEACPLTDYFIMTPVQNFDKIQNMQRFSLCSISQFKATLILNGATTSNSVCMTNLPVDLPDEFLNANYSLTGQFYPLNDQCIMAYGNEASFCHFKSSEICSKLWCRKSNKDALCWSSTPAAEGTTCGSGMICSMGICVNSPFVTESVCPFGDDVVQNGSLGITFPTNFVNCSEFIENLNQQGKNEASLCTSTVGNDKCCSTCLKYRYNNCTDKYSNCNDFKSSCELGNFASGPVKEECCVTCETRPITCETSADLCQNGGTCSNTNSVTNLIGYSCFCAVGFEGFNCEKKSLVSQSQINSSVSITNEPSFFAQTSLASSPTQTSLATETLLYSTQISGSHSVNVSSTMVHQSSIVAASTINSTIETTTESSFSISVKKFQNTMVLIICFLAY